MQKIESELIFGDLLESLFADKLEESLTEDDASHYENLKQKEESLEHELAKNQEARSDAYQDYINANSDTSNDSLNDKELSKKRWQKEIIVGRKLKKDKEKLDIAIEFYENGGKSTNEANLELMKDQVTKNTEQLDNKIRELQERKAKNAERMAQIKEDMAKKKAARAAAENNDSPTTTQPANSNEPKKMGLNDAIDYVEKLGYDTGIIPLETICNEENIILIQEESAPTKITREKAYDFLFNGTSGDALKYILRGDQSNLDRREVYIANKMLKSSMVKSTISNIKGELRKKDPDKNRLKDLKLKFRKEFYMFKQIEK